MSESLIPNNPQHWATNIVAFIRQTFQTAQKTKAVIAVSGGIDSAVSLRLLVEALGRQSVIGVLLPFGDQDMTDGQAVLEHVGVPTAQQHTIQIKPIVMMSAQQLDFHYDADRAVESEKLRLGNLMARTRMMMVYDLARQHDALVCGTENKSEHYLGYFTRFGDAASDLEPLVQLYKTQVRSLAQYLNLPAIFWQKAPSAGLWTGQTDEAELGFSYQDADKVLFQLIDRRQPPTSIVRQTDLSEEVVTAVLNQVRKSAFKLVVPYTPEDVTL